MEQHAENPAQNVIAIIPARYASVRLPGKMLLDIGGKPLILHTLEQARRATSVSRVIVASDDERISSVVTQNGGEAVMTSSDHQSGSDRIAEVARTLDADSIIVNVQGDEPLISPETIDAAVAALIEDATAEIATTYERLESRSAIDDPNIVKVVTDVAGYALYFSRAAIPFSRSGKDAKYKKHTGLYVYRRKYLLEFTQLPPSELEQTEMLEQLRALENGARIKVVEGVGTSISVDTADDLERVRQIAAVNAGAPSI